MSGQALTEGRRRQVAIEDGGDHADQQPAQRHAQTEAASDPALTRPQATSSSRRFNSSAKYSSKTIPKRRSRCLSIAPWP